MTKITAYKGFDANLQCRGFQFEVGQTYTHDGPVLACHSGFHACEAPFDVWQYYSVIQDDGSLTRFAEVEVSGDISRDGNKLAAATITIKAELRLPDFVKRAVAAIIDATKGKSESGDYARLGASGYNARIAASGDSARIGVSGDYARLGASGYNARIGVSGDSAQIAASGYNATIGASGDYAQIAASGDSAQIGASGDYARIGASGDYARLGASGYNARIAASGYNATIGASGDYATINCSGRDAVVAGAGQNARVRGKDGTWVSLASFDEVGKCNGFGTGCIGRDGLLADTWYRAVAGKLVAA